MRARASVAVVFSQEAGERLYGSDERLLPLPLLCMRPMAAAVCHSAAPAGC